LTARTILRDGADRAFTVLLSTLVGRTLTEVYAPRAALPARSRDVALHEHVAVLRRVRIVIITDLAWLRRVRL